MKRIMTTALLGLTALAATAQSTDAEVRKVDKAQGKVTLKHGEIKNLDMPPMTMIFRVKDTKWLDQVAAGDKVKVDIEKIDGQYVVTAIKRAP